MTCADDPGCAIPVYLCLAAILIFAAPFLVWLAGEIAGAAIDVIPIFVEWYLEQWRRARDTWRR